MKNIDARKDAVTQALDRAKLPRDLMGGTPAMQEGGWIRKGAAEDARDYENRRLGAVLFNGFARTLGYLTGQVFKKDLEVTEESNLQDLFERMKNDIDLQGNDLRTFGQDFFSDGLRDGARFILVQYPTIRMNQEGRYWDEELREWRVRTKQTDKDNGWRPYFVPLGYDEILGWRYEYENGVKRLTQLRIMETVTKLGDLDIDDEPIAQVRLLEPGRWSTWRQSGTDATLWEKFDEGETSIPEIPLAIWVPGEELTDLTAKPALEDLAYLNLRHFIATADQHILMAFVRRPPWFGRCLVQDSEQVTFGPGRMIHSTDPNANLQSVGVSADSVEAGRGELKDLEERMSLYGLMMLTPTLRASGGKTATQAQQESSESTSQLSNWAQGFKDCFDQAFKFAAMYEDVEVGDEPEVKLPTDFQPGMGMEPQALITAVERGIIPKQVAFDEFRRRGLISEAYGWEDVLAMLSRESFGPQAMPGQSGGAALDLLNLAEGRDRRLTAQADGTV